MPVSIKHWVELRELPSSQKSEISILRSKNIERVSMIESRSDEFHVLVHALQQTFLHSTHETMNEAQTTLIALVRSLED